MFALCGPKHHGSALQGEHPEILAQSDLAPVDLSVGDIWSQIAAEWQLAQLSQWTGEPIGNHHRSIALTNSAIADPLRPPSPKWGFDLPLRYANGHISATGDPMHFMFGSIKVGFSGSADRMALFPVTVHQIQVGGRPPSWIISNGHISVTAHSIHLYSAHCAVIFAIAQLSCYKMECWVFTVLSHMREPKRHREPPQKARLRHVS